MFDCLFLKLNIVSPLGINILCNILNFVYLKNDDSSDEDMRMLDYFAVKLSVICLKKSELHKSILDGSLINGITSSLAWS